MGEIFAAAAVLPQCSLCSPSSIRLRSSLFTAPSFLHSSSTPTTCVTFLFDFRDVDSFTSRFSLGKPLLPIQTGKPFHDCRAAAIFSPVRCESSVAAVAEKFDGVVGKALNQQFTVVMKFGGSSVASAGRMREVADLILSFPEERPIIVLSAMGKTTNNLLQAGETAVSCGVAMSQAIKELSVVKDLHISTAKELGVDPDIVTGLLEELCQLLTGIALMKELTNRTRDYLVSFGERLSTRIFAQYLQQRGVKAKQVVGTLDSALFTDFRESSSETVRAT